MPSAAKAKAVSIRRRSGAANFLLCLNTQKQRTLVSDKLKSYTRLMGIETLKSGLRACTLCADRFSKTHTKHAPRPIVWFRKSAKILIAGQAPGARVHASGVPFDDPSGDRLRDWLGLERETFYDKSRIAIVPMGFCFPGYNSKTSDLPPPAICAKTWRAPILEGLPDVKLTLLVGGYAQKYHLKTTNVTDTVGNWRSYAPDIIPLPHPSWRNTAWLKRHPWFEAELLPVLKARVSTLLE